MNKSARYATSNTRRGGVNAPCGCSKGAECGYPKTQDEVKYLTQYLKISLDIVLDAKTFDTSGKSDFEEEKRLKTLEFTGFSASFKFR